MTERKCNRCGTIVPDNHSHCPKCAGYARKDSAYGVSQEQDIGLEIEAIFRSKSVEVWKIEIRRIAEDFNEYRVSINEHHHAQDPDLRTALQLAKRQARI